MTAAPRFEQAARARPGLLGRPEFARPWTQWAVLLVSSATLGAVCEALRLPAALLLGPMLAGILLESLDGRVRVPQLPLLAGQALIGCLVARAITPAIVVTFSQRWPLLLSVVLVVIMASGALGWTLCRLRVFEGTTAIWGLLPGAATVMMLMADAFGADSRLVAFMQYLRVLFVALAASLVARLWLHTSGLGAQPTVWFPALDTGDVLATLAVALGGGLLGHLSRLPAAVMLVPMLLGSLLHASGVMPIELPPWLLAISYAFLGWSIGLKFTSEVLGHAARALPKTVLSIFTLMAFCAGVAWLLVRTLGIDPLTAYLATSPGGLDAVAIIAASTKVDLPFVMSLQTARFVFVLALGPPMSRFLARRIGAGSRGGTPADGSP